MNLATVLSVIQFVDFLRHDLTSPNGVRRTKGGALSVNGRGDIYRHVSLFRQRMHTLQTDAVIENCVDSIVRDVNSLVNLPANNQGGYRSIENSFAAILAVIGFIKGYVYAKYDNLRPPRPARPEHTRDHSHDDAEDEEGDGEGDGSSDEDQLEEDAHLLMPELRGMQF